LVGWLEFNVAFEHKYGYIRDELTHGVDLMQEMSHELLRICTRYDVLVLGRMCQWYQTQLYLLEALL